MSKCEVVTGSGHGVTPWYPCCCCNDEGRYSTHSFQSLAEAARYFQNKGVAVNKAHISYACNGKRKTHGGMAWAYADGGYPNLKEAQVH